MYNSDCLKGVSQKESYKDGRICLYQPEGLRWANFARYTQPFFVRKFEITVTVHCGLPKITI
jgi:hypothetical protein